MHNTDDRQLAISMNFARINSITLFVLLFVAFVLRAWHPERMAVEHFDEGVYASNFFPPPNAHHYPDRHLYAPPFFPALLEWVLIFTHGNAHAVMWVNVVLGTALVAAVWWTTRELAVGMGPESRVQSPEQKRSDQGSAVSNQGVLQSSVQLADSAALAAATLVAFSDIMIQYSRAALTDIPVCLWITLAVGSGARAMRTGGSYSLIASAVLTALAWWTKYNGWLPLAILGAGIGAWCVCQWIGMRGVDSPPATRRGLSGGKRSVENNAVFQLTPHVALQHWGLIALGAVVLWLPYLWDLQKVGGYAAVAKNHAGYMVGWTGWWPSFLRHAAVDRYYAQSATAVGAYLSIMLASGSFTWNWPSLSRRGGSIGLQAAAFQIAVIATLISIYMGQEPLLVVGFILLLWMQRTNGRALKDIPPNTWILTAWILGLGLTTPLYRPYPRLILPWLVGAMICAGIGYAGLFQWLLSWFDHNLLAAEAAGQQTVRFSRFSRGQILWRIGLNTLFVFGFVAGLPTSSAWQDRRGLERVADEGVTAIQKDLPSRPRSTVPEYDCVIYVLGEPGLYYQLASQQSETSRFVIQVSSNLGMLSPGATDVRLPTYLTVGIHAPTEIQALEADDNGTTRIVDLPYVPSDLVLLDDVPPAALSAHRRSSVGLWTLNNRQRP